MRSPYTILIGSTLISQLFLFGISPIISRIYKPEEVGSFGIVLAVGAFLATLSTGRLEHALPIVKNRITSIQVSFLAFLFLTSFTILSLTALLAIYFSNALGNKVWIDLPLFLIPAICFSLALINLLNSFLVRQKQFSKIGEIKLYQSFITGILQLIMPSFLLNSSLALTLGQIFGYLLSGIRGLNVVYKEFLVVFWAGKLNVQKTMKNYHKFPFCLAPAAIFNQASQHLPTIAIGYIFGLYSAGLYVFVIKICNVPLALLGQAISQVYASNIRNYIISANKNLFRKYRQLLLILTLIGFVFTTFMVVILFLCGAIFFGTTWANLGIVALLLSPMFFADFVSTPVSMTLAYLDKHDQQLKLDIFRFCSVLFLFLFVFIFELSHGEALLFFSTVCFLNAIIHIYFSYKACLIFSTAEKNASS